MATAQNMKPENLDRPEFEFRPEFFRSLRWCSEILFVTFIGCFLLAYPVNAHDRYM